MNLTLRELRFVIREAIGDRGFPGDKAHLICYVLSQGGGPMTRPDVMRRVEEIEGKDPSRFNPKTNNSYWAPAEVKRAERYEQDPNNPNGPYLAVNPRMVPNDAPGAYRSGVLIRGLVKAAGKRGHALVYELTPKGQEFAEETAAWLEENPDFIGHRSRPGEE